MLIVMAGLPGVGKSTIATAIARELGCALLAVDPIESAMRLTGADQGQPVGLAAYVVAEALAAEQLIAANDVIVDAVNDDARARDQWDALALRFGERPAYIEVRCDDELEHRSRLTRRGRRYPGLAEPTWDAVLSRRAGFESWGDERLQLDARRPIAQNTSLALKHLLRDSVRGTVGGNHHCSDACEPRAS